MFRFKNLFLVGILLAAALMDEKCVYAGCTSDSDCPYYPAYCCEGSTFDDGVCRSDCIGEDCDYSSDCAPGECCGSGKCKSSVCYSGLASWIVAAIVISVLLVVAVPVGIVVCCCCCVASASSRPRGGFSVSQISHTTDVKNHHKHCAIS